jgi:hypothetical protein
MGEPALAALFAAAAEDDRSDAMPIVRPELRHRAIEQLVLGWSPLFPGSATDIASGADRAAIAHPLHRWPTLFHGEVTCDSGKVRVLVRWLFWGK